MSKAFSGGLAIKLLWLAGLAVSGYLTFEHYTAGSTLVCADSGLVNCSRVTTSQYSFLFGVPVALLGLLYFAAGCVFAFLLAPRWPRRRTLQAGTAFTGAGVLFVLYLVWAELVMLGQICSWCTVVHVITVVLFFCYLAPLVTDGDRA